MPPHAPAPRRRDVLSAALGGVAAALAAPEAFAQPAAGEAPRLFRVVGPRDAVIIGFAAAEFEALGSAPGVERSARRLVAEGQVTAWQHVVGRGPDGSTRHVATRRVAVLRNDALRLEPYAPSLPVSPPPAEAR